MGRNCLEPDCSDNLLEQEFGDPELVRELVAEDRTLTRAYENGIPVCFVHPEQALVCLPDGTIGAILESNVPGVLVHDLDLGDNVKPVVNSEKASSHPMQNRRPELYGAIVAREMTS